MPHPTMPMRSSRSGCAPTPSKRGRAACSQLADQRRPRRAARRRAAPDRRGTRRGRRRESSFHSDDCAPAACSSRCSSTCSAQGNSMSPGTPTTIVSAVTLLQRGSQRTARSSAIEPRSIDFAEEQERLDRESARRSAGRDSPGTPRPAGDRARARACRSARRARRARDT